MAEKEDEKRKLKEEAEARTQDQEAEEKRSNEQQSRREGADGVGTDPLQVRGSRRMTDEDEKLRRDKGDKLDEARGVRRSGGVALGGVFLPIDERQHSFKNSDDLGGKNHIPDESDSRSAAFHRTS